MTRRREIRTKTTTTQVRIEFTAAELRKRLRLPEGAVLMLASLTVGKMIQVLSPDEGGLVATYTRTSKPRPEGSA